MIMKIFYVTSREEKKPNLLALTMDRIHHAAKCGTTTEPYTKQTNRFRRSFFSLYSFLYSVRSFFLDFKRVQFIHVHS